VGSTTDTRGIGGGYRGCPERAADTIPAVEVDGDISGRFAIAGLGVSRQGRKLGVSARELRLEALERALTDAGLGRRDIDGHIGTSSGMFDDIRHLGLAPRFSWSMQSGGATAIWSVVNAIGAILTGQADVVACSYAATPSSVVASRVGMSTRGDTPAARPVGYGTFSYGYPYMYGMVGAAAAHAFHARRHMERYGTTSLHLGAVAVAQRAHAVGRPEALGYGQPITIDDHQSSRMVVDPFRLLDCCRDTDGGVVVLVTSTARARDLRARPVAVLGMGTGHNIRNWWTGEVFDLHDDIAPAKATAFGQAGLAVDDVDVASLYDPFTISPIMQLEAYGFCGPGEGGPFVASGATGLDGAIPTNTGGGQLSGFYATGFTALVEGIWQMRGEGGATQVPDAEVALVSGHGGNGGVQNTWAHCTLLLGADR
jgi:acetyl-CoA acetyltransferase